MRQTVPPLVLQSRTVVFKSIFFCIVDHSKGVYMHDHPDFPSVIGGKGTHFTA